MTEVGTIQLGRDVHGQLAVLHRRLTDRRVRRGGDKITAQRKEDVNLAVAQSADRIHRVVAVLAGRLESKLITQFVKEGVGHLLPNSHGAIPLDVAVAANGRRARARTTDVASQEEKIHDLVNGGDGVAVWGDA